MLAEENKNSGTSALEGKQNTEHANNLIFLFQRTAAVTRCEISTSVVGVEGIRCLIANTHSQPCQHVQELWQDL